MANNILTKMVSSLKTLLVYKPLSTPPRFILKENEQKKPKQALSLSESAEELHTLLRFARRLATTFEQAEKTLSQQPNSDQIMALKEQLKGLSAQSENLSPVLLAYTSGEDPVTRSISASLEENILIIKQIFKLPHNKDTVLRQFSIPANPPRQALLLFINGLADEKAITASVLMPLFNAKKAELGNDILKALIANYLTNTQTSQVTTFLQVANAVGSGYSALFVEGASEAILLCTKGFERRAIGRPMIEQTIRGSQAAFTETLQTNISLVRLALRSPDLVSEIITLGARSQIDCAVMYLQTVANPTLVGEVKRRLSNITTDYIAAGSLDEFIEDDPQIPLPQTLSTERPDRVSSHLAEGRIAILLDGDPFALVVPVSLFTLFHSPEDFALQQLSGTFMRIFQFAAAFFATVFPAIYISISYFHQEALPTDLVLAIAGARERIPFPAFIEVLFMEFSLEFIREASTRKPGLLGETLGIVGGIILGQAVVTANLISPPKMGIADGTALVFVATFTPAFLSVWSVLVDHADSAAWVLPIINFLCIIPMLTILLFVMDRIPAYFCSVCPRPTSPIL